MFGALSKPKTLWTTFALTLLLTLGFGVVMHIWQFGIIDEMFHADEIRAHIDAMSPKQRAVHAWMTGTLDVAYPFAYGGFFAGVAIKAFGRFGPWLALPALLVIPFDLLEGFSQVMLLTGHDSYMGLKTFATPFKLLFWLTGMAIAIIGLAVLLVRSFKAKNLSA